MQQNEVDEPRFYDPQDNNYQGYDDDEDYDEQMSDEPEFNQHFNVDRA